MLIELLRKLNTEKSFRTYTVNKEAINTDLRTVEIALSSEEPYQRWFGIEILSHSSDAVDLTRLLNGAPLLAEHDSTKQIGVIENARIDGDKVLRCTVRLSKNPLATEYFNDIVDGIRSKVSVGYEILEMEKTGQQLNADGICECDIYTVTKWLPYEGSFVSIPADDTVGVGRSKSLKDMDLEESSKPSQMKDDEQDEEEEQEEELTETPADEDAEDEDKSSSVKSFDIIVQNKDNKENKNNNKDYNMLEIIAAGKKYKKEALALEFIEKGKSEKDFLEAVLEERASEASKTGPDAGTAKEYNQFSMVDFVREQVENRTGRMTGMAKEFTQDAQSNGRTLKRGGLIIPSHILYKKASQRDYNVTTPANGGNTAATGFRPDVIDALYNNSVVLRHADIKPSATGFGQVDYPIITSKNNFYQLDENQRATDSNVTFDNVHFKPKTSGGRAVISRDLLKQSSIAIESVIVSSLLKKFREYQDDQLLNGDGTAGNILGLLKVAGVNVITNGANGGLLTFPKVVDFESEINAQNAQGAGNLVYFTNAKVAGILKSTQKFPSFGDAILANGEMNGYAVETSNQIASNGTKGTGTNLSSMLLGNFEYAHYIEWDGYEFIVNPYRLGAGQIEYEMFATYDFQVSRPIAFSVSTDIATA